MKKSLFFILLLSMGCSSATNNKQTTAIVSDLNTDFPIADTIRFQFKQNFESNSDIYMYNISDSILWTLYEFNGNHFGSCYNINTGARISTILNKGRAANEINVGNGEAVPNLSSTHWNKIFLGDSIQILYANERITKILARKDILDNVPMSERKVIGVNISDSISFSNMIKLPTGAIFGVSNGFSEGENDYRFFISDNNQLTKFGGVRKELFEPQNLEIKVTNENILQQTSNVFLLPYKNKIAVINRKSIFLNIVDINEKNIYAEKYYDKIVLEKHSSQGKEMNTNIFATGCNDLYIFCFIKKRDFKKTKEGRTSPKEFIVLVFDWDLNPIKKIYLDCDTEMNASFMFSENCESIYYMLEGDETRQLMEGKITI